MQDETQTAAATSSPDPLAVDGPGDRDIDVLVPPPNSADSYVAWIQSWPNVARVFQAIAALFEFVLTATQRS
jgi:hypothetical protein